MNRTEPAAPMAAVVRRPFLFGGKAYEAGEVFDRARAQCTERKFRQMLAARTLAIEEKVWPVKASTLQKAKGPKPKAVKPPEAPVAAQPEA